MSIPWVEQVNNGEKMFQYMQDHVKVSLHPFNLPPYTQYHEQDEVLRAALERSYSMFKVDLRTHTLYPSTQH